MSEEQRTGASIFHEVKTAEQGKKYILELINQVIEQRNIVDTLSSPVSEASPQQVQTAFALLKTRYGQALGSLMTLMHCRVLDDVAYEELRQKLVKTQQKRMISVITP